MLPFFSQGSEKKNGSMQPNLVAPKHGLGAPEAPGAPQGRPAWAAEGRPPVVFPQDIRPV